MPELSAELLSEAVAKGLENVERGVTDFSDWSRLMVYQFGEQIRLHLESVWERIKSERGERLTALPPPSSILPSTSNYQHPPTLPTASAAPIKRKGNYFVRHWRGDLSLGVSYWLNGLLAYLLVAILAGFVVGLKETAGSKGDRSGGHTSLHICHCAFRLADRGHLAFFLQPCSTGRAGRVGDACKGGGRSWHP